MPEDISPNAGSILDKLAEQLAGERRQIGSIVTPGIYTIGERWWEPKKSGSVDSFLEKLNAETKEANIKIEAGLEKNTAEAKKTLDGISKDPENKNSSVAEKLDILGKDKSKIEASLKAGEELIQDRANEAKEAIMKRYGNDAYIPDTRIYNEGDPIGSNYQAPKLKPEVKKELDAVDTKAKAEIEAYHNTDRGRAATDALKKVDEKIEYLENDTRRRVQGAEHAPAEKGKTVTPAGETHEQSVKDAEAKKKDSAMLDIKLDSNALAIADSLKGKMTQSDSFITNPGSKSGSISIA